MKKHSSPFSHWFDSKNRKQTAFTSSVILIGILFVVAIVSILVKKGPSADSVTSPNGRLAKLVNLSNGELSYNADGTPKTKPSNSVPVRIKFIPGTTYTLEGLEKANQVTGLPRPSITVKTIDGAKILETPLAATITAGINGTQVKSSYDSDLYRNNVNQTNKDLDVTQSITGYLRQNKRTSDPKSVVFTEPFKGGNFTDEGESNNIIDEADASVCGPQFKLPVTNANKICDLNYDGQIDEADSSIWGPNFRLRGSE